MEQIAIIHRKSQVELPSELQQGSHWKTCLRQMVFLSEQELCQMDLSLLPTDQIFVGENALSFLLEILCGLHSPIVGETEVFGQFKAFVEARKELNDDLFGDNQKWLQFILAEVKRTRSEKLIGLGSHSYGSLLRKLAKDNVSVAICGSGQLAQEILPWISAKSKVQVICRRPEAMEPFTQKFPHLDVQTYEESLLESEVLVIAAPLRDTTIEKLLHHADRPVKAVYDLRGELNQLDEILEDEFPEVQYTSLKEFFAQIQELKNETQGLVASLKQELKSKSHHFVNRIELRPMGWDDICA